jgi:uncharacterized repeat protein (TIGR01451 family)
MLYDSPVTGARTARKRRLPVVLALALVCAGLLAFGAVQSFGNHLPPACTSNNQQGTLCVTVSDTPDPVAYSGLNGNSTFILYHVELSNGGKSNLSHVGLEDTLPAGTGFFSATPSQGTCSRSGQTVTCALGSLSKGQVATVDIVVTAPVGTSNSNDITITNVAEGSFDENFNDQPNSAGGKVDTITYSEPTTVSKTAVSTFVPKDQTGTVSTDVTQTQTGKATLHPSANVLAKLGLVTPTAGDPFSTFCPSTGQVKIGNKTFVCRQGGYIEAAVTCTTVPAPKPCVLRSDGLVHYSDPANPNVYLLQWAGSLVPSNQTVKNFVVFYQPDGSTSLADVIVISNRCDAGNPPANQPCLRNISENKADGSWSVELVRPDNGHMR